MSQAFAAALARPAWFKWGRCRAEPTALFFDPVREDEAKAMCAGCAIRPRCLEYALVHPELEGIWAGTTTEFRRELMQRASFARTAIRAREALTAVS